MKRLFLAFFLFSSLFASAQLRQVPQKDWKQLFNGKNLDGWAVKIRGFDLNDNFGNTFSVKNKNLVVNYDKYDAFKQQYGHIFYKQPFSYYRVAVEYRFIGEQAKGGEGWATLNSGVMVHGQPAESMGKNQDFPVSIEVQLLGQIDPAKERTTCNLCTPGTNVVYENKFDKRHCINSKSKSFPKGEWVRAEILVLGDSLIQHYINNEKVMEYTHPSIGGGNVSGHDPIFAPDGKALKEGSISLQSESHPIEFRKVELLNLVGCMNPKAKNYKDYYVKEDNASCKF